MKRTNRHTLEELASLFFVTRQIIRQRLPQDGKYDPNAWLRNQTLQFIASQNGPTMHDVATFVRITAPSATSLVGHLEKLGYIRRKQALPDKRIVRIYLTPNGKRKLAACRKNSVAVMRTVFGGLSAQDIEALRDILSHLRSLHT